MAVGFWNFVGAGMFGFLINLPIVSYYEVGTLLTPNHGHAAMMGVFGMLAIALMVFVLRQTSDDAHWPDIEKYVKVRLLGYERRLGDDGGVEPVPGRACCRSWDVLQNGYWHARSLDYIGSERSHLIEWLRLPGDVVFIVFGAAPLVIATIKCYFNLRAGPRGNQTGLLRPA